MKNQRSGKKHNHTVSAAAVPQVPKQKLVPAILRDPSTTAKVLEAIYESPNGKRSLSRVARTCRALSEPALSILWRDLDSLAPIVGLFPGHLLKKAKKPGLGLSKVPHDEDWQAIIKYSERIRRITYDETSNNTVFSIFSILEENRPKSMTYLLPRLQELTWKVESATALERCMIFFGPSLQIVNLEVGTKIPQLTTLLTDMSSRTILKGFSFVSPTSLPESFTDIIGRHTGLEKVVLVAPGALGPGVGRWVASLHHLKQLQLDLTGRAPIAVEGFFDELRARSGDSTPSSIGSRDSGIFSGEELDFTEIRKSALRLTGDLPPKGAFARLRKLHLTGEVANIAVFLKHLESQLVHLELVIEDPPDNADWQDLSTMICDQFGQTLQSLRITATASSKFIDLVRSTSRGEPPSGRLSFEQFTSLPNLTRLEVDLPESVVFTPRDIECIARACPRLETLRLCPLTRFIAPNAPKLTLESLTPLTTYCRRLHTLGVVFNASMFSQQPLSSPSTVSPSILRLHVGHSWITDPLQTSIFLSHIMPRLDSIKWFQEKTRVGFNEVHSRCWQNVSDTLPHLQMMRVTEKSFSQKALPLPPKLQTAEKAVSATVPTRSCAVQAQVKTVDTAIQSTPTVSSCGVSAAPEMSSIAVDATPTTREMSIETETQTVSVSIQTSVPEIYTNGRSKTLYPGLKSLPNIYVLSSFFNLLSFVYRFATLPVSFTSRLFNTTLARFPLKRSEPTVPIELQKQTPIDTESSTSTSVENLDSIPLDPLQVRHQ